MDFELSTFTLEVRNPNTGEPIGLELELQSMDSDAVKAAMRKWDNGLMHKRSMPTAEQSDARNTHLLASAVVGLRWKDGASFKGEELEFSLENVKKIYKGWPFVRNQVNIDLGNEANFYKA